MGWCRTLVGTAALTAIIALTLAACATGGDAEPASGGGTAPPTVTASPTVPAPGAADASSPTRAEAADVPGPCTAASCPALTVPTTSLMEGAVTKENASRAVPGYLRSVLDDLDETWGTWFATLRWGDPSPGRVLVGGDARFTTRCTDDRGQRVMVRADTPNAFYCDRDRAPDGTGRQRQGAIVLPVDTFVGLWNGTLLGSRRPFLGEFTAATVVAHEYGHDVVARIAMAGRLSPDRQPLGDNDELIADCLAGTWAATVLKRDQLSVTDIVQAVTLLGQIGDAQSGEGHGTAPQRIAAISRGFAGADFNRQGQPIDCLSRYWPEVFG